MTWEGPIYSKFWISDTFYKIHRREERTTFDLFKSVAYEVSKPRIAMSDIEHLKSLQAVRERANLVLEAATRNELTHFTYHPDKMDEVAQYVSGIINVRSAG